MINKNKKRIRGFTLVEVMVASAIFSLFIAALYAVLNTGNAAFLVSSGLIDVKQQARNGMFWLVKDLRQASEVTITAVDANTDTITFTKPADPNDPDYPNGGDEEDAQYYLDGNQLVRSYPNNADTPTIVKANGITYMKFSQTGNFLTIDLRSSKTSDSRATAFNLRDNVVLRNNSS